MFFGSRDARRLMNRAADEAASRDVGHVGREHLLLALVHPDEETLAARMMRACRVDYEAVRAAVQVRHVDVLQRSGEHSHGGVLSTPAVNEVVARAEGFAAGLGETGVRAEDVLLALIWTRRRDLVDAIGRGGWRSGVVERLRLEGARVPATDPPSLEPAVEWGEPVGVPLERLMPVVHAVRRGLGMRAPVAFNHDGERGWVWAAATVDLEPLVKEALESSSDG